jgi:hypothetical protein
MRCRFSTKSSAVTMWIPSQQHKFLHDTCTKYNSCKKCHESSGKSYLMQLCQTRHLTHTRKYFEQTFTFWMVSIQKTCANKEKLCEIDDRLKTPPSHSLVQFAQQREMSVSSARNATKLQRLHSYKTTVVHKLYDTSKSKNKLSDKVPSWGRC